MATVAVLSHIVVDEVFDADRVRLGTGVGGAGAYAAVGASLADADAAPILVSGVGRDDHSFLADWCVARGISAAGLFEVGRHSPRTRIQYFADGERDETPVYGLDHFDAHTPLPRHIPVPVDVLDGVYLFHDHQAPYWDEVEQFRRVFAGPLLWEISLDSCRPQHLAEVRERLEIVDILSINEAEALALLGVATLADAVERLRRERGVTVLLRRGARGSVLIADDAVFTVGTVPTPASDPTGGGNSYTGAFLAAYAGTGRFDHAARVAAATASAVVAAPGAPEVDDVVRRAVQRAAQGVSLARQ